MQPIRRILATSAPFACLCAAPAAAQQIPVFSTDWKSPTISQPDAFTGTPITEGDLLAPQTLVPAFGPLGTPGIVESGGALAPAGLNLGLHAGCVGHAAFTPCAVEVDALSHGLDALVQCNPTGVANSRRWAFSVDFHGLGVAGSPVAPAVWTEGPCQDEGADAFHDLGLPCGPLSPAAGVFGSVGYLDGDGLVSCSGQVYPGTGLIENVPGTVHGDNLDALDDDVPDRYLPSTTCTYISLDSSFVDPVTSMPNSGSAVAHGFVGGDVLRVCPGCAPSVYASAFQLGLSSADLDDLDALALRENGIAGYQRSSAPYDWMNGQTDMLFFSVRRGSAIIGTPDSLFGIPISEGDILFPTGAPGSAPGIWIAAENLGLMTLRTFGGPNDDLDALDTLHEREQGSSFCLGDGSGTPCPCANNGAPGRGCGNSQNASGALLWSNGNPSLSSDTVHMTVSGLTPTASLLLYQGTIPLAGALFGDGLRCVGGNVRRLQTQAALCGNREFGFGVPGNLKLSQSGGIGVPGTVYYQVNYRDANPTFCSVPDLFNLTNGYHLTWVP